MTINMWSSCRKTSNSVIVLIVSGLIAAANGATRVRRILGGVEVDRCAFPFNVRLVTFRGMIIDTCSGAVVTDRHILTAGHCLEKNNMPKVLHCGMVNANDPDTMAITVQETIVHHKFIDSSPPNQLIYRNDIGIVVLQNALTFGQMISKIPLTTKKLNRRQELILAGWGKTSETDPEPPQTLRKISVKILKLENNPLEPYEFCGTNSTGDFCDADSGAPLITAGTNPVVIGIAVRSNCEAGDPHTYTNVYTYLPWIYSKIPSLRPPSYTPCPGCNVL